MLNKKKITILFFTIISTGYGTSMYGAEQGIKRPRDFSPPMNEVKRFREASCEALPVNGQDEVILQCRLIELCHAAKKNNDGTSICPEPGCGKSYATLSNHVRTHMVKLYRCKCGASFSFDYALQNHVKKYEREREQARLKASNIEQDAANNSDAAKLPVVPHLPPQNVVMPFDKRRYDARWKRSTIKSEKRLNRLLANPAIDSHPARELYGDDAPQAEVVDLWERIFEE